VSKLGSPVSSKVLVVLSYSQQSAYKQEIAFLLITTRKCGAMVRSLEYVDAGMGTRRKSSRPRRDRDAHLPIPRRWLYQPRRDVKISRRDRDETFV